MGTDYLPHTRGGQPVAPKLILREYGQDSPPEPADRISPADLPDHFAKLTVRKK
ncbi:hypothetical protein [Streptomyces venezuelae]|uniref:hypothetical protein n=1 Tax=Streptomyces venezuelae TaxID=54571 RepID=UPI00278C3E6D|nr:hypothetical protein [Streptomyces venezuelae]